jgi:hypothetical protein
MKRYVVLALLILNCIMKAQEVSPSLEGLRCQAYKGGVLLYGYEKGYDGYSFSITRYDNELKILNKYSKKIPGEVNIPWSYCSINGNQIEVFTKAKPFTFYIRLTENLVEESATESTPEVEEKERAIFVATGDNTPIELQIEKTTAMYERGFNNIMFLGNDRLNFNYKEQSLIRHERIAGTRLSGGYKRVWVTAIESADKVKSTGIIYADEKDIFNCFISKGPNKLWDDFIVRLDSKTGKLKYKIPTVYPDMKEKFFLSNAYFDPETEKIIAVGQLYPDKLVLEMHAAAILIYDKEGKMIASKMYEFSEYEIPDAPGNINLNQKAIVVKNIGKSKDGGYFLITEHRCLRKGTNFFATVGFSYNEINAQGDVISNIMTYIPDLKFGAIATVGQGNEKFMVLASSEEELLKVQLINFEKDRANMIQTIDSFNYMKNLKYVENKDVGVYKQFILDERHTVIFHKYAKSNKYDLKSITVK